MNSCLQKVGVAFIILTIVWPAAKRLHALPLPTPPPAAIPPSPQDGFEYVATHQTLAESSFDYLRPSESINHWSQRWVVHLLPYDEDRSAYAEAVATSVLLYAPQSKPTRAYGDGGSETLSFELAASTNAADTEHHQLTIWKTVGGIVVDEWIDRTRSVTPSPRPPVDVKALDRVPRAAWKSAVNAIRWYIHSPHVFVEKKLVDAPFSLSDLPHPPPHAWLYIRPNTVIPANQLPLFIDAVRAYRATGLDLKKQTAVSEETLTQILTSNPEWPVEPGWQRLIDGLRYLNVKGTPLQDSAMATMAQMTALQVLILNDLVTDSGLRTVAATLTHLVKFRPGGALITDRGMTALTALTKLHRLDLSDTSVTDAGVKPLQTLSLIEVDFGAQMGNGALETLSAIPTLVHLDMSKSRMTAEGIPSLRKCVHLHTLFIGAALDDRGVNTLVQIPTLRRLDVTHSALTDRGLRSLGALRDLEELALSETAVTNEGLGALAGMTHLRFLEVSDTHITPEGLGQLASLPALDVVSFSSTATLTLRDLKPLGKLPALRTLIINGAPLHHGALEYLKRAEHSRTAWRPWEWIASAWAETSPGLTDDTAITQVSDPVSIPPQGSVGLHRIHDVEASLDEIIPDVSNPIKEEQDTAENFLGEFTVNSTSKKK